MSMTSTQIKFEIEAARKELQFTKDTMYKLNRKCIADIKVKLNNVDSCAKFCYHSGDYINGGLSLADTKQALYLLNLNQTTDKYSKIAINKIVRYMQSYEYAIECIGAKGGLHMGMIINIRRIFTGSQELIIERDIMKVLHQAILSVNAGRTLDSIVNMILEYSYVTTNNEIDLAICKLMLIMSLSEVGYEPITIRRKDDKEFKMSLNIYREFKGFEDEYLAKMPLQRLIVKELIKEYKN